MTFPSAKRPSLSIEQLVQGVLEGDRTALGRAITLVESSHLDHMELAGELLGRFVSVPRNTVRIGITGVPGVGKSTFIEAFGSYLLSIGKKVAVIAVDPSSSISGGSILGDKTRMETLVRNRDCFIRPVPSKGALGGVAANTTETILLCEAAGFDVVLVETVGVGQNEVTVRDLVDFFLLLMLPNAGDNLQGMKRGIMELADHILINKADGENRMSADAARNEYQQSIEFMRAATSGWKTSVDVCSALEHSGMETAWAVVQQFVEATTSRGTFTDRRQKQQRQWLRLRLASQLQARFFADDNVKQALSATEDAFLSGKTTLVEAIQTILAAWKTE
ncbi:MAG: methylmalonyl Co-A mutase-associated GTPase MeaB [Deltaproteobacteria bacterium]|nr:methylmalonyl Co-A mutase-associated GTPase MeaB [Deltaproteobacteria bacterium]MBN2670985.1 methylmalonyl Co-A mutase-associated GTPase MeaB [Deltaproteobacteria bacterium]